MWEALEFLLGFVEGVYTEGAEGGGVVGNGQFPDGVLVLDASFKVGGDRFCQVALDWLVVQASVGCRKGEGG